MSLRRTFSSVADSTLISIARLSSEYKDLDVAVLKATNYVESPPKEKHVRTIFLYTSATRPRADVAYCIYAIAKRLGKSTSWIVSLKCLMVIHRTLREGDPTFREELINFERNRGRFLNIGNFKDDSGTAAWDYSAWIRTYAQYLEERLECFRILKYDVESERSSGHSKTRELETGDLLEHLPALQSLLQRLMACQPEGAAVSNLVVQAGLGLVLKESFKLYRAINDGIINLVDKFFEMEKQEAAKGLEIYKRAGQQAEKLSEFYDMCKSLDLARSFQFPTLEQPPQSFLSTMEEYVRESKPPERRQEVVEETSVTVSKSEVQSQSVPEEPPPPPPPAVNEPADFLGLDSDILATSNGTSQTQLDYDNAMALAIVPQGDTSGAPPPPANGFASFNSTVSTGWELALVSAPSSTSAPPNASSHSYSGTDKLGGGLDKLTLDSLYEDALRRSPYNSQSGYSTGNPNQSQPGGMLALPAPPGSFPTSASMPSLGVSQDPFEASTKFAPPPSVQMAQMAQQQHMLFGYHPQHQHQQLAPQGYASPVMSPMAGYALQPPPLPNPFGNPYGAPTSVGPPVQQPVAYQNNPFGNPNLL